jgi:hypothetical protein
MKKIIILVVLLNSFIAQSQIFVLGSGNIPMDPPAGSYIKDLNNELDIYVGTWVWQQGNEIVTFKIQKAIHELFENTGVYYDYLVGDYKYTTDNGSSYVVNTIDGGTTSLLLEDHPMYGPGRDNDYKINFSYKDMIETDKPFCSAVFQFLPGSTTQMHFKLTNNTLGRLGPIPYNANFSIPTEFIVTRQ